MLNHIKCLINTDKLLQPCIENRYRSFPTVLLLCWHFRDMVVCLPCNQEVWGSNPFKCLKIFQVNNYQGGSDFFFNFQNNLWLYKWETIAWLIRKEEKFQPLKMEFTHTFKKSVIQFKGVPLRYFVMMGLKYFFQINVPFDECLEH